MFIYTTAHQLAHISNFRNIIREKAIDVSYTVLERPVIENNSGQVKLNSLCLSIINNPDTKLEAISYGVARNYATENSFCLDDVLTHTLNVLEIMAGLTPEEISNLETPNNAE